MPSWVSNEVFLSVYHGIWRERVGLFLYNLDRWVDIQVGFRPPITLPKGPISSQGVGTDWKHNL
jgi:hypothetical protein